MFGRRRRSLRLWLFIACLGAIGFLGLVFWQLDKIQPRVIAMVGIQPSATPGPSEYARRADQAYWQGDLNTAVDNYRFAAQSAPHNVDIVYELARMLIYRSYNDVRFSKDIDEAQTWATQAAQAAPGNSRAHAILCYALVRASKSDEAVRSCIRAIDLDQGDADAHAFLSMAYYDLGRTSSALDEGQRAVQINPQSIDAHTAYAFALWFQNHLTDALDHFKAAAEINQRLEFPYFNLGGFATAIGVKDETKYLIAIDVYNTVLSFDSKSVKAYTRLCQAYFAKASRTQEDIRLAQQNCEKAVELDATYSEGWRWLGQVQYFSRNYEGAQESLLQCSELEKDLPAADREPECWFLRAAADYVFEDGSGERCLSARPILDDMLGWTTSQVAIDQAHIIINKCLYAFKGEYRTPTPVPTPTPRPTPIL